MPIEEEGVAIQGSEYVWDIYQESVKMSTYLVAFVVSDFVYRKSEPMDNGVEFRIWSRKGAINQTKWASEIGPQILHYYEDYFNTSFPLPKHGYRVISGVSKNIIGRYVAWNWIRQNWGALSAYYDTAISSSVGRIISAVAADFNTEFELQELQTFISDHED